MTQPTFETAESWEEAVTRAFTEFTKIAYCGYDEYGKVVRAQIDTKGRGASIVVVPIRCAT